jgi:hypothetical protein
MLIKEKEMSFLNLIKNYRSREARVYIEAP